MKPTTIELPYELTGCLAELLASICERLERGAQMPTGGLSVEQLREVKQELLMALYRAQD